MELPRAYVEDVLRELVPGYVEYSRQHPAANEAKLERSLREARWPDADGVLAIPALRDAFIEVFGNDVLSRWFGAGPPEREPGCVLNTLDHVEVDGDRVAFAGTGRRSGIPVRYQDA